MLDHCVNTFLRPNGDFHRVADGGIARAPRRRSTGSSTTSRLPESVVDHGGRAAEPLRLRAPRDVGPRAPAQRGHPRRLPAAAARGARAAERAPSRPRQSARASRCSTPARRRSASGRTARCAMLAKQPPPTLKYYKRFDDSLELLSRRARRPRASSSRRSSTAASPTSAGGASATRSPSSPTSTSTAGDPAVPRRPPRRSSSLSPLRRRRAQQHRRAQGDRGASPTRDHRQTRATGSSCGTSPATSSRRRRPRDVMDWKWERGPDGVGADRVRRRAAHRPDGRDRVLVLRRRAADGRRGSWRGSWRSAAVSRCATTNRLAASSSRESGVPAGVRTSLSSLSSSPTLVTNAYPCFLVATCAAFSPPPRCCSARRCGARRRRRCRCRRLRGRSALLGKAPDQIRSSW